MNTNCFEINTKWIPMNKNTNCFNVSTNWTLITTNTNCFDMNTIWIPINMNTNWFDIKKLQISHLSSNYSYTYSCTLYMYYFKQDLTRDSLFSLFQRTEKYSYSPSARLLLRFVESTVESDMMMWPLAPHPRPLKPNLEGWVNSGSRPMGFPHKAAKYLARD